ncbi:MAG: GAF domain-containing sensor histidine kinase [Nocardioidaceae bacterium]|nr:GAF domain-containing sensor histidine kinase [Nocardioidaceae bacterium]NUS52264.1 GAF domain-containing sensor histidine kinase [Nocardioidaceae bacterium]
MEEIEKYGVLGAPPRRDLEALVALAAQICDVPRAAINLITSTEQVQVAAVGMEPGICSRDDSMCAAVLDEDAPVILSDARADPRFADNPFVTGVIGRVRFYAANHLVTPDGVAIGTLCVFDDEPRELDERQNEALRSLADRVVDVLELGLRTRQLERSLATLTRIRDELRRSNELLGSFAGQAAHDLRNPLSSVSMSLEMLGEQESVRSDEDAAWMLERALSGAQRMDRMIADLLDYGRLGGGLQLTEVDLRTVMADVRSDLAGQLVGADLVLGDLPVVHGDATQVRAVLQNLVANALKFTRPVARPRVAVSARSTPTGWRVEVADNGPGVPVDQRERVFEPLVQGDRKADGIGLGLAICARVVRAHGGTIGLDEAPGGGALVWFDLPVRYDARELAG